MTKTVNQIIEQCRASQNKQELEALLNAVSGIDIKNVLEIGVHKGYSLELWQWAFNPNILIGIEPDCSQLDINLITKLPNTVVLPFKSTEEPALHGVQRLLKGEPLDFLFLDGDHTYEAVKQDFRLYAPFVRPGGVIVLHDVELRGHEWNGLVEVNQLWNEIKDNYEHMEFYFDGGTGTGVLYV